jgi:hypothetical protein
MSIDAEIANLPNYPARKAALERAIVSRAGDAALQRAIAFCTSADRFRVLERQFAPVRTAAEQWANRWKRP